MAPLIVPPFPLLAEPGDWDVFSLWAGTVFLEAEGEPPEGKLGVSWVTRHRVDRWGLTPHQVILGPEGRAYDDGRTYEPYSCWNDDYRDRARARLSAASGPAVGDCWRAAAGALWCLVTDPVPGAMFYLNVEVTRRLRKAHDLPAWAADPADPTRMDPAKLVGVMGRHHFLTA